MIQFWQLGRAGLGEPRHRHHDVVGEGGDEPHACAESPAAIARCGCILLRRIVGPGSKQPCPSKRPCRKAVSDACAALSPTFPFNLKLKGRHRYDDAGLRTRAPSNETQNALRVCRRTRTRLWASFAVRAPPAATPQ